MRSLAGASVGWRPTACAPSLPRSSRGGALARQRRCHIHIAEQLREVEECLAWCGLRPIEWLLANAPADERWCLVHATHAEPAELQASRRGAVAGCVPITESSLGDGIFPAAHFSPGRPRYRQRLQYPARCRRGTAALEYSQRLAQRARNVLASGPGVSTGRSLFAAALEGGARALHGPQAPGAGLAVGSSLDLVTLRRDDPSLIARREDELLDSWIFAAGDRAIDGVWRAGVKVVANGQHRRRDAIRARYAKVLGRLLAST